MGWMEGMGRGGGGGGDIQLAEGVESLVLLGCLRTSADSYEDVPSNPQGLKKE